MPDMRGFHVKTPTGLVPIGEGPKGDKGEIGDSAPSYTSTANGLITLTAAMLPSTRTYSLVGNVTIAALPSPSALVSGTITLVFKQATGSGPFTVTWPTSIEWPNDAPAPAMPTVAASEMVVHLLWTGNAWRALHGGNYYL